MIKLTSLRLTGVLIAMMWASGPASAQTVSAECEVYGNFGKSVATFLLPQKMQDVLDMAKGLNPELARDLGQSIDKNLSPRAMEVLDTLPNEDIALIGELAGQSAIQILLSAQVTAPEDLQTLMMRECEFKGIDTLLNQLKKAKRATNP